MTYIWQEFSYECLVPWMESFYQLVLCSHTEGKKAICCGVQIWVIPVIPLNFRGLLFLICTAACSPGTLLGGNDTPLGVECQQKSNDLVSMALCNIGLITSVGFVQFPILPSALRHGPEILSSSLLDRTPSSRSNAKLLTTWNSLGYKEWG